METDREQAGDEQDAGDRMEERLDELEGDLSDARQHLKRRQDDAVRPGGEQPGSDVAGDAEDEDTTPSEAD